HKLRPAAVDGIFFTGDSAGHCLPLTAEGIRTALYFGLACGTELRAVADGRQGKLDALRNYASFSASHRWKFEAMLEVQKLIPKVPPRVLAPALRAMSAHAFLKWSFGHYLAIAPPEYARASLVPAASRPSALSAALA